MNSRKQQLEHLRQELTERLDRYEKHQHRSEAPLSKQFDEQNLTLQTDEVIESLEDTVKQELAAVNHALARLEQGAGDDCERCGEPINPQRLASIPFAVRCIKCAD